jgi:hypothetical protein
MGKFEKFPKSTCPCIKTYTIDCVHAVLQTQTRAKSPIQMVPRGTHMSYEVYKKASTPLGHWCSLSHVSADNIYKGTLHHVRYARLRTCIHLRVLALVRCEYDAHMSPRVIYVTRMHMPRVRHAGAPRRVRQVSQYDASKNTLTRSDKADTGVGTTAIPQHVSPHVTIYAMPWSLEIPGRNPSKFLGHGISFGHVSARHVYT